MLLTSLTKLVPLISLAVTVTAIPARPSALDNAVVRDCESDFARCTRLRISLDYCRALMCNSYNSECKPCQADAFPGVTDHTVTQLTNDNTAVEVQVLDSRAGAKPPKNYCIVICTHAYCGLLCTNPSRPPSAVVDDAEVATNIDTADLLDLTDAQPDKLGVPLKEGMTTVITTVGTKDNKREKDCMWVCSGKVNCRQVCWATSDVKGALIEDIGSLPEGEAVDGMGDCEVVDKGGVGPLMVCQVPEVAGGDALAAGDVDPNHCLIVWMRGMPQITCHQV
ncbi:uncharacterized protein M421DRAFT_390802 [Didymella exigua CBS 183.55]|uniref:Uncharacterized protein n=1 Tax=Didymella exigua CBS 183.55 TaxID=1150837 RepID=A0A6A5RRK8_9PLEO|nr:uncharacterized protein M421DRAFT_390802 [Didymella exigua CBS 183.55]KAF1928926.1 hypothetical protein M421DRAFT_390802 [Didymella exigua CBS 183.55]